MGADPLTIMMFSSAVGGVMDGITAGRVGAANQAIHNRNADILRMRANEFVSAANREADMDRDKGKRLLADQSTDYLKSGVEVAGSPVEVLGVNAAEIEYDAQITMHGGKVQAYEARTQAANEEYQGRVARWRGNQQKSLAFGKAGMSLVGAAWGASGGLGLKASPVEAFQYTGGFTGMNTSGIGFFDTMKYGVSRHPGSI
jgi:hypothetical protein